MFAWLKGPGEAFRHPLPDSTNYLSAYDRQGKLLRDSGQASANTRKSNPEDGNTNPDELDEAAKETEQKITSETREDLRPFPLNTFFISQSIVSEALRQEIWRRVQVEQKSVRQVSVELGVEMRRVGAVVRLVELEKRMRAEGKPLAIPYAKAIHSMVPTTPYDPSLGQTPRHEPINDLPQHSLTGPQIFYPTSESRAFNRVDAGRVFSSAPRLPNSHSSDPGTNEPWQDTRLELVGPKGHEQPVLKPADSRIPHPHLIATEKDRLDPVLREQNDIRSERYYQRLHEEHQLRQTKKAEKEAKLEARQQKIDTQRWQFVVTDVKTTRQGTGLDGRGTKSPGFRYGVPAMDRKRGQVKIPKSVQV